MMIECTPQIRELERTSWSSVAQHAYRYGTVLPILSFWFPLCDDIYIHKYRWRVFFYVSHCLPHGYTTVARAMA